MAVSSYGSLTDSSGVVRILKDLDAPIEGRDVLIVEDVVDSGLTLGYLLRSLRSRNPRSLEVCALLVKPHRRRVELADPLRRFRDTRPVRGRLWPRPRSALPQPAVRGGVRGSGRWPLADGSQAHRGALKLDGRHAIRRTARKAILPTLWNAPDRAKPRATLFDSQGPDCLSALRTRSAERASRQPTGDDEQILQERRFPDPDRGRAGVLRPAADQPRRVEAEAELRPVPDPGRERRRQERHDQDARQHAQRHRRPTARPSTRPATRTTPSSS